jgi:hypothetical protein
MFVLFMLDRQKKDAVVVAIRMAGNRAEVKSTSEDLIGDSTLTQ